MVAAKNDGPVLPPMTPGLIHTPTDAIHNLFGAVFFQALNEGDLRWLNGLDYLLVADLAGIDRSLAERVRRMQLAGQIKPGAFAGFGPAKPPDFRRLGKVREQGTSTAGPVAVVRAIAASMPDATSGEVVRACVAAGINYSTADAQVRKHRKALAELKS